MASIRVQTTQNVTVEYEIAGLGERLVATIIDYLVYAAWGLGWLVLVAQTGWNIGEAGVILLWLPVILYYPACEIYFDGQTLGKRARGLRVVRLDGTAPRIGDYLLRWLLLTADNFFFLGIISLVISERGQRLGDRAAGTTVVKLRPPALHDAAFALPDDEADYRVAFPEAARLTDRDASLVRRLLTEATDRGDTVLLYDTARRVRELTGIESNRNLREEDFLRQILRDHAFLAVAGAE